MYYCTYEKEKILRLSVILSILIFAIDTPFVFAGERTTQIKAILAENSPTVILTNSPIADSFDPLDGDYTKNLRAIRLLYATPLEYNRYGAIQSRLLRSFKYSEETLTITLVLDDNLRFSNGKPITVKDLTTAICRMALSRPSFDFLKHIRGIEAWLKLKFPLESLPSGLEVSGNTLRIKLTQKINLPLHGLTAELFSVIPEECIDKKSSKLTCGVPPFSGIYELTSRDSDVLKLTRRVVDTSVPLRISLIYISPAEIIKYLSFYKNNHVIIANELDIPAEHRRIIATVLRANSMPEARIFALVMNPNSSTFSQLRVRQFFAAEYRKTVQQLFSRSEGSIFTKIMPGYLSQDELEKTLQPFSQEEKDKIISFLRRFPPHCVRHTFSVHSPFEIYLGATLKRLGIPELPAQKVMDTKTEVNLWKSGTQNIRQAQTGLRSPDPTQDLKMLFTKNMHYFLSDLYGDSKLQTALDGISHLSQTELDTSKLKNINKYLFNTSIFAVTANYSIMQFTQKNSSLSIINDWTSNVSHYFQE